MILPNEEEYTTGSSFNYKALENKTYSITVKNNVGLTRKCFIDITKIDKTKPTNVVVGLSKTTIDSITVIANAIDNESGIVKYEFSIDGGSYINNGKNKIYTFNNLSSSKHDIKVRVTNGSGLTSESSLTTFEPGEMVLPTFKIDESNWATSRTVTITYPEKKIGYVYQYRKNEGQWITVSGIIENVVFNANGTLIARIQIGTNTYTTDVLSVEKIDATAPTSVSASLKERDTKSITIAANGVDLETGISKYEFSIDGGIYIDNGTNKEFTFTDLIYDEYTVKVRVTNNVGLSTESSVLTTSPNRLATPTITMSTTNWSLDKTATITYQSGQMYYYSLNGAAWNQVLESTITLNFTEDSTLVARVSDGINEILSDVITIDKFDNDLPSCKITTSDEDIWTTSKTLTITGTDASSGVFGIKVPNALEFTEGSSATYNVSENGIYTATVQDNAKTIATCSINVEKIDSTSPVSVSASLTNASTNTLTIKANALDLESGITKYEFSIDDGAYINNNEESIYTFTNVTTGQHTVKVRVTNGSGLTTESSYINVEPGTVMLPIYGIDNSGWAPVKNVTITYPERQPGYIYEYSTNGEDWSILGSGVIKVVNFTDNGFVIARIYDGLNYFTATTFNVTQVDTQDPTCQIIVENENNWTTSKLITVTASD